MSDCFAIQRTTVLCILLFIHTISANCKNKGKHITLKRNFMLIPVQIFNTEFCFFKISESEPEGLPLLYKQRILCWIKRRNATMSAHEMLEDHNNLVSCTSSDVPSTESTWSKTRASRWNRHCVDVVKR